MVEGSEVLSIVFPLGLAPSTITPLLVRNCAPKFAVCDAPPVATRMLKTENEAPEDEAVTAGIDTPPRVRVIWLLAGSMVVLKRVNEPMESGETEVVLVKDREPWGNVSSTMSPAGNKCGARSVTTKETIEPEISPQDSSKEGLQPPT